MSHTHTHWVCSYHDGGHHRSLDHPPEDSLLIRIPAAGSGGKGSYYLMQDIIIHVQQFLCLIHAIKVGM